MNKCTTFFLLFVLMASCGQRDARREAEEMIASANNMSEELVLQVDPDFYEGRSRMAMRGEESHPAQPRMAKHMIRTGEYRFAVDDLDTARAVIHEMLKAHGGYVQGDELNDWRDRVALVMRVRIPADRFEASLRSIDKLGRLEYQMVQAQDVSAEWTDVDARIKAKKTLESRYLELIAKSDKVSELLEVERELGKVRAEIESMEARMRMLSDQVAMSTLTITCVAPISSGIGFAANAASAFRNGGSYFVSFTLFLLEFWPFILIIIVTVWMIRLRRKALKRRKVATTAAA